MPLNCIHLDCIQLVDVVVAVGEARLLSRGFLTNPTLSPLTDLLMKISNPEASEKRTQAVTLP